MMAAELPNALSLDELDLADPTLPAIAVPAKGELPPGWWEAGPLRPPLLTLSEIASSRARRTERRRRLGVFATGL